MGYDPDLRFIEGYSDKEDAIKKLNFNKIGLDIIGINEWRLETGRNAFKRPLEFHFAEFWLIKK